MARPRPASSAGNLSSGPVPVPEYGSVPGRGRRPFPIALALRTGVVALVVVIGVASSGIQASRSGGVALLKSTAKPPVSSRIDRAQVPTTTTSSTTVTSTSAASLSTNTGQSRQAQGSSTLSATAESPTSTTGPPVPYSGPTIQARGTQLYLNGSPYHFVGVNAYELATQWGVNAGCGAELSDAQLNQLFSSRPANSLVRFWAFQATIATNMTTHQLDWGPLDRVFAAAAAHNQRLIAVIGGQGSGCDSGHWQDPSWYSGGFRSVYNDPSTTDGRGLAPLSYWTYLQDLVSRYAGSPALGMWEPMSEAEASTCPPQDEPTSCSGHQTCPNESAAAIALRYFFDTVGAEIHSLDPNHLVESGLLGGGQCGTQGMDYQYVSASPGIDVLSYHDYYGLNAMGGDQWNGLAVRFHQSVALKKPIVDGEAGLMAGQAPGCMTDSERNAEFEAKAQAQAAAGSSGMLLWDWVPSISSACSYDIPPSDNVLQAGGIVG